MPPSEKPLPPVIDWKEWYVRQWKQTTFHPGQHILFDGPTQSGKTTLCRLVTRFQPYVVVLGTKPVDASLDAYIDEGYVRIDHWPPTKDDIRKAQNTGARYSYMASGQVKIEPAVRFILWPKITKRSELKSFKPVYAKCLDQIFVDGGWCVVMDEGLWLADRRGLDLGEQMSGIAYGSASNGVSMHLIVQRPAGLPPVCWLSCMQALVFHSGHPEDVRKLAGMGVYPPKEAISVISGLQGRQFLDLPCRGMASWCVSEVDPTAI
jgi:hypothetical protein